MKTSDGFDLQTFLPYLLNRAAESTGQEFQKYYRDTYGLLRTEWRVLFHLFQYGDLTATEICQRATLHKTKVSRAVTALEKKRFLGRQRSDLDRRQEALVLTAQGRTACENLARAAEKLDRDILDRFTEVERAVLRSCLLRLT